jgi:hypothetical protein
MIINNATYSGCFILSLLAFIGIQPVPGFRLAQVLAVLGGPDQMIVEPPERHSVPP